MAISKINSNSLNGDESTLSFSTSGVERMVITSAGNVGIGTDSTGGAKLRVTGSTASNGWMYVGYDTVNLLLGTGTALSGDSTIPYVRSNSSIGFATGGGTERMRIDSIGRVTMPYQPAFYAYWASQTFQFGSGITYWDTTKFNIGSHYDSATGRFTAPVAGLYHFTLQLQHYGNTAINGYHDILHNGNLTNARYEHATGANYEASSVSVILYLNASDYVYCNSNNNVWWSDNSYFCGYLIG